MSIYSTYVTIIDQGGWLVGWAHRQKMTIGGGSSFLWRPLLSQAVFFRYIFSWPASESAPRGHRRRRPRPLHARRAGLDRRPMLLVGVLLPRASPTPTSRAHSHRSSMVACTSVLSVRQLKSWLGALRLRRLLAGTQSYA